MFTNGLERIQMEWNFKKIVFIEFLRILSIWKKIRTRICQNWWEIFLNKKSFSIGKRRVTNDFTNAEAKLLKILIYMGQAIDDDSLLYKDISSDALFPKPAHLKGQNKSLGHLYQILKQSKRFMGGR